MTPIPKKVVFRLMIISFLDCESSNITTPPWVYYMLVSSWGQIIPWLPLTRELDFAKQKTEGEIF